MKSAVVGSITRSFVHSCMNAPDLYAHLLEVARQLGWPVDHEHPLVTEYTLVLTTVSGGHTYLLADISEPGVIQITAKKSGIYRYDWNGNLRQIHTLKARLEEVSGFTMMPISRRNSSSTTPGSD